MRPHELPSGSLLPTLSKNMPSLNIVFAGTPDFAARHLQALVASEHTVCGVYTQPDRPAGRGKKISTSDVKNLALKHELPIFQPDSLKSPEAQKELAELNCDLMVVVAYGLLLPSAVLDIPRLGCINVHGSILPKWRGAAPIQRAVEAGDDITGVTIMQMDEGLDTGDMLLVKDCPIHDHDTSADIYDRLSDIGPPALLEVVKQLAENRAQPQKQDNALSTYAKKIEKSEAEINWQNSATIIDRKVRAFNPFPICYTTLKGERLRVHRARLLDTDQINSNSKPGVLAIVNDRIMVQCGEGVLEILSLQLPGKKAMDTADFLNGFSSVLSHDEGFVTLRQKE